jgi:HEAT repeat protein
MYSLTELLTQLTIPETAADAAFRLAEITDQSAFDGLISATKNDNSLVRNAAVLGLAARRDARAVPAIMELLKDPEIDIRASAAFALGKLDDADCIPALRDCLQESINTDAHFCRQLMVALTDLCGSNCADTIAMGLESSIAEVRATAAEFLG